MMISILSPDLSYNCLGRAWLLAKILQTNYDVEIVGPISRQEILAPCASDKSIIYKTVKFEGRYRPYFQIPKLIEQIDGDIIYASKPVFASFGIGLILKCLKKSP